MLKESCRPLRERIRPYTYTASLLAAFAMTGTSGVLENTKRHDVKRELLMVGVSAPTEVELVCARAYTGRVDMRYIDQDHCSKEAKDTPWNVINRQVLYEKKYNEAYMAKSVYYINKYDMPIELDRTLLAFGFATILTTVISLGMHLAEREDWS